MMCADHDQSVRSWASMKSMAGVEIRDGVDGMIGKRVRGLMNGRTNERSKRRRERMNERRREHERGNEVERMEEKLVMVILTWNVQRMAIKKHNRRRLRSVCEKIQKKIQKGGVVGGVESR